MKKVGSFIKKNKERIITFAIIIIVLFLTVIVLWWCLQIGIITPPKSVVLWYFNNNRETFDYIAEYVEDNPETRISIVYPDPEKMMKIEDDKLRDSMEKIFKSGGFSYISYNPSDKEGDIKIRFLIPNFSVKEGEGVAIIYSEHALQSGCEDVGHDEVYYYEYERIDGNWYYKYRVW